MRLVVRFLILLSVCIAAAQAQNNGKSIQVDGVINASEWADAQVFDQFVSLQPFTKQAITSELTSKALIKSTPAGLAVAFEVWQPSSINKINTRVKRDFRDQVDRVNVMVDFAGDGRSGYSFTLAASNDIADEIITNENQFNADWDGNWQHAVHETAQGYSYELLIPYSIATMPPAIDGKRKVKLYLDRVVASTGQRFGFPAVSFTEPRFLSDFYEVEIDSYTQSLLAVTPYAVALGDLKQQEQSYKAGTDIFWKPSSNHQFALTLNPDFGQVESDQLVVNFDAIETFFTDKRPFFTENQAAFAGAYPGGNLFYTRRVGGAADDGSGPSDINAAIKANGNISGLNYAVFAANEAGAAGRDFAMARVAQQREGLQMDFTQSLVNRPFLDRQASVSAAHVNFKPNSEWSFETAVHQSVIDSKNTSTKGYGGGVIADWDMPGPFRQQYFFIQVDDRSNLNDLGFQDRNNFRYLEWETGYRQDQLPDTSRFASHAWELELANQSNGNNLALRRDITVQRYSELRDGGNLFFFLRKRLPTFDDLISRGNGIVRFNGGMQLYAEGNKARQDGGAFALQWNAGFNPGRTSRRLNYNFGAAPRWFVNDNFDISVGLYGTRQNDWLLWRGSDTMARFQANRIDLITNLNWFISERQELRVKLENIAIDAELDQAFKLRPQGVLQASDTAVDDFRLRNLGFQIRYRYKLGNLSDLYVIYSRGGADIDQRDDNVWDAFGSAFELRDNDQFLIKLAYRFERQ